MKKAGDRKSLNKSKIVRFILEEGETSKVEIAKELGLSMPTVLQNIKELEEAGIVREIGEYESTGGRKARMLALVEDARYSAGLDITANHVSMVLVNMNGEIKAEERRRKKFSYSLDYCNETAKELEDFLERAKIPRDRLLGAGISLPGIVDNEALMLLKSHAFALENVSLHMLAQSIPYPVAFENDANAAIMAEGRKENNIYLSLSNTVGGSVWIDGKIFKGHSKKAGEFGHMILVPGGRPCYCGKKGCVDAYCSAQVLASHADGSLEAFMAQVENREKKALVVWEEYLDYLAIVISNLRMAYDTDITLGGYVGGYLDKYMLELGRRVIACNLFDSDISYLKTCSYQKEASAVGAAKYFIEDYVNHL